MTKICSKCKTEKQMNSFSKNKDSKDGLRSYCKDCDNAYQAQYRKDNPHTVNAKVAKRHAAKLQRTVAWANLEAIKEIYRDASDLTKLTGISFHVDHIIPMQGKLVSGLHVETNLQILSIHENCSKHNKFNPEEYTHD